MMKERGRECPHCPGQPLLILLLIFFPFRMSLFACSGKDDRSDGVVYPGGRTIIFSFAPVRFRRKAFEVR